MDGFKKIFKNIGSRVWFIVTAVIVVIMLVANILLNTLLYDIVCQALGRRRAILDDSEGLTAHYEAEFDNKDDARKNGEKVNEEITGEGMVLLKNENDALPLKDKAKISVFGKNSVNIVTGGTGSAAGGADYLVGLDTALTEAGFELNTTLWNFYTNNKASGNGRSDSPALSAGSNGGTLLYTGETPLASYTDEVKASYANYKEAALIVISRIGGESWDLPRAMTGMSGARDESDHYLQLDKNETDLIKHVCASGFEKVVVLLNMSTTFELGFLDDTTHYAYDAGIDACLWMGVPGDTGVMSLGKILKGEINPSGRTVDTFVRDFKKDPTWQNFGDNNTKNGGVYTSIGDEKSGYTYAFVDYEEGIYVGYRYYETRALDEADGWYKEHVVYPFGYGKSYTTFTQKIASKPTAMTLDGNGNGTVEIGVEVTNSGAVSGKDTVQIYVTAPFDKSHGIEKAHVVLAGFAKTPIINGGDSKSVPVSVDLYDIASYDMSANGGKGGYVLEAGDYEFKLMKNSHEMIESFKLNLATTFTYTADPVTHNTVENRFADADDELTNGVMKRGEWESTFPEMRTSDEKKLSADHNAAINSVEHNNPNKYTTRPTMDADPELDEEGNQVLTFRDMAGKPYDDPDWEKLLDMCKFDEMVTLINSGAFKTTEMKSINKAETVDADGPSGFADFVGGGTSPIYGVTHYCCEPLMAATFNVELLESLGKAVGNEALVGNLRGDGMPYSGWYAPGVNIHRSPFGGRAGEYFSEDPYLTGMLASYEIKGAMSKGVYTMVKHFAVNEQETSRSGVATWLDEQTLREIYLRPFEKTVKVGKTRGMMSSFNRIGTKWTGGDYRLMTEVLRDEWGFEGTVISDYNTSGYMNTKQAAYAGGDLGLNGPGKTWNPSKASASDLNVLRNCTKNILYTTVNSNLINANVVGYKLPYWQIGLIVGDVVLFVGLAVWGVFAVMRALKKED